MDLDTPKEACRDPAAMLLAAYAEWHLLGQLGQVGGLVMGRSGYSESAAWLHAGVRRFKTPFDKCGGGVGAVVPRVELGYPLSTPLNGIPAHELQVQRL